MRLETQTHPSACIWMQAGVVANKPCFKDFHCQDCRFDQAMSRVCRDENRTGRAKNFVFWQEKLRQLPVNRRPCIHHMKGRIDFKSCTRSYHCTDCEFDQFFQDQFKVYTRVTPVDFNQIRGFALPTGYYLSHDHIWVKMEGSGMVSIGVDDFICRLLGRFDTISLPLLGKPMYRTQAGVTLGRENETMTFPSPVTGVITDVNPAIAKDPNQITAGPYTNGWLATLVCQYLKQDIKDLMFMEDATRFMENAVAGLYEFLEDHSGLAAADGGELTQDIFGALPGVTFKDLGKRFFPNAR